MKSIFKICLLFAVLLVVAFFIIGASVNAIVKAGVETMGPQILGVPVTIEEVDISLLSGGSNLQGSLTGLLIKNPEGFHTDHAFSLPTIRARIDQNSILTDTILIDEIVIDGPVIIFEESLNGNSNLGTIQKRIKGFSEKDRTNNPAEQNKARASESDEAKKVQINRFIFKNAKIHLSVTALQGQTLTLKLPDIQLQGIGEEAGGITLEQASAEIFEGVYRDVTKTVSGSGKLFGARIDLSEDSVKELGKAAEKAGRQFLKDLLD
jgi:uncharacterized protein involved in outer membrane biogenesis